MTTTTDNQQELFDVVNANDEVIGQATRGEVHRRGLMHRAVHIFVFNFAGHLYLQKRSQTKDKHPGCYDSSASGHHDAGEDADTCAQRELREELGLEAGAGLTRLFKIPACAETGWEHVTFYTLQTDAPPQPNPREIESGRFFTLAEVLRMIEADPRQFTPGFLKVLQKFGGQMGKG
ncbi:MAG: NUDIX domain-containing protein [Verrucomicrobia bacterium]|nr:NUDIX domain-containing protein [Verrucomicrobiota bacterium]